MRFCGQRVKYCMVRNVNISWNTYNEEIFYDTDGHTEAWHSEINKNQSLWLKF